MDDFYLEREVDDRLYRWLSDGNYCYVFSPPMTGKTTLLKTLRKKLEKQGFKCGVIDLKKAINDSDEQKRIDRMDDLSASWILIRDLAEQFYLPNGEKLNECELYKGNEFRGDPELNNEEIWQVFIKNILLQKVEDGNIIILIDDAQILFNPDILSKEFCNDFLSAIQKCCGNNRQIAYQNQQLRRINFVFFGERSVFHSTTFNEYKLLFIKEKDVILQDFTLEDLNRPSNQDLINKQLNRVNNSTAMANWDKIISEVLEWTDGHPLLTHVFLRYIINSDDSIIARVTEGDRIDELIRSNIFGIDDVAENFSLIEEKLRSDSDLRKTYARILSEDEVPYHSGIDQYDKLINLGLLKKDTQTNTLKVRNQIYQIRFDREWVEKYSDSDPINAEINQHEEEIMPDPPNDNQSFSTNIKNKLAKINIRNVLKRLLPHYFNFFIGIATWIVTENFWAKVSIIAAVIFGVLLVEVAKESSLLKSIYISAILWLIVLLIFNITQQPFPAIQEKITVFCLIFLSLLFVLISFERLNSLFIRFVKQHRRLVIISVLVLLIIAIISILNSIDSYWLEAQESELAYLKNTGKKNVESAMKSDKELEALEYSIENGKKLEQLKKQIDSEDTKIKFLGLTLSDQRKVRNDFKKTFKEQLPTETLLNLQKIGDTLYQENRLEHPKSGRSFTSVAFSSDGNKIVTGDNKGELILWKNLEEPSQGTGQRKATPGTIHSLTFSPNNQKIAIGSTNGVMEVWDISNETNTPVRLTGCNATGDVKTLNFSKNDQYLVAGTLEGDICLWDVTDNTFKKSEKIRTKSGEKLKIHKVVFSPDYSRIAVAKSDGQIELRKTNDLTRDESIQPWTLRPLEFIFDLDFNQQGDEIIAAGKSGKVSVFKLEYNGEKPQVIKDFSKELLQSSVEDNPFIKIELQENNQFTVIREYENNLRLLKYDLEKEKQGKTFYLKGYDFKEIDNSKTIINASFNQETQRIVTVANGESVLRIWRVEDKQNYKILETDSERLVNTLSFRDRQGDNRVVGMVTIDNSGKVQFWNEKKITEQEKLTRNTQVIDAEFMPDGNLVVTAEKNGRIEFFNLDGNELEKNGFDAGQDISQIAFIPTRSMLAVLNNKTNTLSFWDDSTGELKERLFLSDVDDPKQIEMMDFSLDGKYLLVAGNTEATRRDISHIFDVSDPEKPDKPEIKNLNAAYKGGITSISFSPDGDIAIAAKDENEVFLWDESGEKIESFNPEHQGGIAAISFSKSKKDPLIGEHPILVTVGNKDKIIKVWIWDESNRTGKQIKEFKSSLDIIKTIKVNPDGEFIGVVGEVKSTQTNKNVGKVEIWPLRTLDKLLESRCEWLEKYHNYNKTDLESCCEEILNQ